MTEQYWAFLLFAIVMTGTPGPGNLAMMGIGQSSGFRAALPFLTGTILGAFVPTFATGLGLGGIFTLYPWLAKALGLLSLGYILYLSWKILRIRPEAPNESGAPGGRSRRFTLAEGLLLHPLNPKGWAMCVTAYSQFADPAAPWLPTLLSFSLTLVGGLALFHSLWCAAGASLLNFLRSPRILIGVKACLVALMLGSTGWALLA